MNVFFDDFKGPGIPKIPTHIQHPEQVTQFGETYLWVIFGLMAAGVLIFAATSHRAAYRYRVLHVNNLFICSFAAIAYFAMASGIGKTLIHSDPHNRSNYREVYFARYIDWALTTPLLLLDLTLLAGLPIAETAVLIVADEIMIVTGLIGALHPSLKYRWGFFGFSCIAFAYVVFGLVTSARQAAFLKHPKVGSLYNQVSLALAVSWTAYPVVWAFCEGTGKLSADTEVLLFGILDVIAKPIWGLWIILAIPAEGHVLLPEWAIAPSGSVGGGSYGAVPQHDSA
ncbi:hypothetical protein CBS101457_005817 [Exobasidium rhododendri]|nr:hypothetical protein CBS101457_005817 [Exobasidium rhododendri]